MIAAAAAFEKEHALRALEEERYAAMRKSSPERRAASETVAAELKLLRETIELATSPSATPAKEKAAFSTEPEPPIDKAKDGDSEDSYPPSPESEGELPGADAFLRDVNARRAWDRTLDSAARTLETAEAAEAPEAEAPSAAETPVEAVAPEAEASEPTKATLNPKPVPAKKVTTTVVTTKTLARAGSGKAGEPGEGAKACLLYTSPSPRDRG